MISLSNITSFILNDSIAIRFAVENILSNFDLRQRARGKTTRKKQIPRRIAMQSSRDINSMLVERDPAVVGKTSLAYYDRSRP